MNKRNANAITAQSGASNPRPIAQALVDAIDECRAEGVQPGDDPAVALILHQLAHVLGQPTSMGMSEWDQMMKAVEMVKEQP